MANTNYFASKTKPWIKINNIETKNHDFTKEQTKQWITVGLTASEVKFATWLRDVKSKELENFAQPQWIKEKITTGELDLNELRKVYQEESKEVKIDIQAQVEIPHK